MGEVLRPLGADALVSLAACTTVPDEPPADRVVSFALPPEPGAA